MATPLRPLPAGTRPRRLPGIAAIIVALGVLAAVNLLIFAMHTGGKGQDNLGSPLPQEIEYLVPVPGSVIRPQEDVGADLKDTYTGALFIDDVRIPQDETKFTPGLGQVSFRPGPNKEITALAPGHHYATIHYWPQEKGDEDAARAAGAVKSYTWQFTAG
ncbi:MAG TPA: hypothetical protein VG795_03445 [Acidimicrobiia bacterium]|nr:hypothetical protein [Acidimicrobiia bacterium]